ncbi:MAG: insulinase family protein [Planctomycetes bacterium]|nr:insulinase family protein [Planctomycetota bacterium]
MKFRKHRKYLLAIACLSASGLSTQAMAQQSDDADVSRLEEIVVTGSRGRPRTVADSPVPIDVFTEADLRAISYTDTNDILKTLVPSFNLGRQPISDGASFIRPAELRGLPTDKTLVLINSKRRHRSALVSIGGSGTQGPDIATIPSIALKNIEVLRDGASAQYGSDAIAGVINFILKDASDGASISIDGGEYSEGDGAQITIQGNIGLPLGDNGFLNLSAEYYEADAASRSEQYCESWFCVDQTSPRWDPNAGYAAFVTTPSYQAGLADANIGFGDVVQPWGQPEQEATRFFFNSGYQIDADTEVYAFGNYSESESDGSFFYRYPRNGTIEVLREADGGLYDPLEKYPGGFTPRFFGEVFDFSLLGGVRGVWDNGLNYDISARYGESEIQYVLSNTINPSQGRASKQSFDTGDLINEETQFQADFTYEFESDLASPLLLAFGGSYMDESYEVVEGERDSWDAGPHSLRDPFGFCNDDMTASAAGLGVIANGSTLDCANGDDPVYTVVGVGANGFPGFSPQFSELYERSSYALYADLSADITDQFFLQGAIRFEDYDDFDTEKGVILEEIAMYKDNPFTVLYEEAMQRHYDGGPHGHRVLGTEASIKSLTSGHMRQYFDARYSSDNTVVAMAGKLDFQRCVEQIESLCGAWEVTNATRDLDEPDSGAGRFELRDEKVSRAYMIGISAAPPLNDDRRYAAMLASQILGSSDNSRLHWALIESGLADEAQAEYHGREGLGEQFVYASGAPERADEIWSLVERELSSLADSVSEDDLARLRERMVTGVTLSGERPADRMQRIGRQWTLLGAYLPLEEELTRIGRIGVNDVRDVLRAFDPNPTTIGVLLPAS